MKNVNNNNGRYKESQMKNIIILALALTIGACTPMHGINLSEDDDLGEFGPLNELDSYVLEMDTLTNAPYPKYLSDKSFATRFFTLFPLALVGVVSIGLPNIAQIQLNPGVDRDLQMKIQQRASRLAVLTVKISLLQQTEIQQQNQLLREQNRHLERLAECQQ
jgi:hypothetical protein